MLRAHLEMVALATQEGRRAGPPRLEVALVIVEGWAAIDDQRKRQGGRRPLGLATPKVIERERELLAFHRVALRAPCAPLAAQADFRRLAGAVDLEGLAS